MLREARITLRVHPMFGEVVDVLGAFGPDAVWIETAAGRVMIVPAGWTDLRPSAASERSAMLAIASLMQLAAWVEARRVRARPRTRGLDNDRRRKLVSESDGTRRAEAAIAEAHRGADGGRPANGRRVGGTAAVVEQARSARGRGRGDRDRGAGR